MATFDDVYGEKGRRRVIDKVNLCSAVENNQEEIIESE